jgi:hypothetical protein
VKAYRPTCAYCGRVLSHAAALRGEWETTFTMTFDGPSDSTHHTFDCERVTPKQHRAQSTETPK